PPPLHFYHSSHTPSTSSLSPPPLRRPPPPTLFPYTTLFRSTARRVDQLATKTPNATTTAVGFRTQKTNVTGEVAAVLDTDGAAVDRKSTRLNSSHLVISYAVFCLKKKRINHHPGSIISTCYT